MDLILNIDEFYGSDFIAKEKRENEREREREILWVRFDVDGA